MMYSHALIDGACIAERGGIVKNSHFASVIAHN